jgi:hypothetical protein
MEINFIALTVPLYLELMKFQWQQTRRKGESGKYAAWPLSS